MSYVKYLSFARLGNFFLSGAALVAKLNLTYTAIASTKNFINMPEDEVIFWKQIHNLANRTYSRDMFLSHEKNGKEMVNFLREGNFLGGGGGTDLPRFPFCLGGGARGRSKGVSL